MNKASREEIRQELSNLGSSLPAGGMKPPSRVPDHYFDHLPRTIQERIAAERKPGASWLPAYGPLRIALASFALVAVLAIGLLLMQKGTEEGMLAGSEDAYPEMFLSLYADLDPYMWYEMLLETDLTADELYFGSVELPPDAEEDAFLDYLLEKVETYELNAGDYIFP